MKLFAALVAFLLVYVALLGPLSRDMAQRQTLVKLGYVPDARVVEIFSGDQKVAVAALYSLKSIVYYGEMIQQWRAGLRKTPEFANLFSVLESSVRLDPYNMDNYYFAQASFTWGVNRAEDVNRLLEYGMEYRTWDWLLPYYAGFNAAYFLNDKATAAKYMGRAANLTGNTLLTKLTARYLQGAGRTAFAIDFLDGMIERTRDQKIIQQLLVRKQALQAILEIETAIHRFEQNFKSKPKDLESLAMSGYLPKIPQDPYGGTFFLDQNGAVQTSSRMTFAGESGKK